MLKNKKLIHVKIWKESYQKRKEKTQKNMIFYQLDFCSSNMREYVDIM